LWETDNNNAIKSCPEVNRNMGLCQIMGEIWLDLEGLSSVNPGDHMFETCALNKPSFKRDEFC